MAEASELEASLERLRAEFPWPASKPEFPDRKYGWGISSEELLLSHIPEDATCILEVGSLFGGSARFFADARSDATVICVDPWKDTVNRPFLRRAPELRSWLDQPNGAYQVFLSSNWEYRDRVIPVRGFSPEALRRVFESGCRPDFIYIDGAHHYEAVLMDLSACRILFPSATLGGDDWMLTGARPGSWRLRALMRSVRAVAGNLYPTRRAVEFFAARYGYRAQATKNTWILTSPET